MQCAISFGMYIPRDEMNDHLIIKPMKDRPTQVLGFLFHTTLSITWKIDHCLVRFVIKAFFFKILKLAYYKAREPLKLEN